LRPAGSGVDGGAKSGGVAHRFFPSGLPPGPRGGALDLGGALGFGASRNELGAPCGLVIERDSWPRVVNLSVSDCGRGVKLGLDLYMRGAKLGPGVGAPGAMKRSLHSGARVVGGAKRVGGVGVPASGRRNSGVRLRLSRPRCTLRSVIGLRWMLLNPVGGRVKVWMSGRGAVVVRGVMRPREISSAEGRGGAGRRTKGARRRSSKWRGRQ
jgi:hypothetical protein